MGTWGLTRADHCDQVVASARNSRSDRADWTPARRRRFVVTEAEQLGEHERFAPFALESADAVEQIDGAARVDDNRRLCDATMQATSAGTRTNLFEANMPSNSQQPDEDGSFAAIRRQCAMRADVGLLREVVGTRHVDEAGARTPDVELGYANETGERDAVALRRALHESDLVGVLHGQRLSGEPRRELFRLRRQRTDMTCEQFRESISAAVDGEHPGQALHANVEAHLQGCADCRTWEVALLAMQRRLRIASPSVIDDRTEEIVSAVYADAVTRRPSGHVAPIRVGLALVAIAQLVLCIPVLVLGHDHAAPEHVARELGAFTVAVALGFALAAVRPRLAAGMVPVAGIAAVLLLVTAGTDIASGATGVSDELPHLLELGGFLLLVRLAYLATGGGNWTPLLLPMQHLRGVRAQP